MHKKVAFAVAGLLVAASPLLVAAQSDTTSALARLESLLAQMRELQAQLLQLQSGGGGGDTSPSTVPPLDGQSPYPETVATCLDLRYSIGPDDTDAETNGEVSKLQRFLQGRGMYSGPITGYAGPLTVKAIQKWQSANVLVSSGTPDSTGYGYLGPKSRAKLACGGGLSIVRWNVDDALGGRHATFNLSVGQTARASEDGTTIDVKLNQISENGYACLRIAMSGDINTSMQRCVNGSEGMTLTFVEGNDRGLLVASVSAISLTRAQVSIRIEQVSDEQPATGITVMAPNGGERFALGDDFRAKWQLNGRYPAGTKVCINLTNQSTQVNNVPFYGTTGTEHCAPVDSTRDAQEGFISGQLGQGHSTNWLPAGTYKVRAFIDQITHNAAFDVFDESDSSFYIVDAKQPSGGITVTAPNGGEQWEAGVMNSITWAPYGYNPDVNPSRNVDAYLERKNADGSFTNLGSVIPSGKASIHWVTGFIDPSQYRTYADQGVGQYGVVAPGQYYIRVVNHVTGQWDRSDAPFTVLPKRLDLKVNGSDGPVTVDPNAQITLSWTASSGLTDCRITGNVTSSGAVQNTGSTSVMPVFGGNSQAGVSVQCKPAPLSSNDPYPTIATNNNTIVVTDTVSLRASGVQQQVPSVRIVSPNGGERVPLGEPQTVTFGMSGVQSYSAALYRNDQWQHWIYKDVPAGKEGFTWTPTVADLGAVHELGQVFKIYITGKQHDGIQYVDDKSDAPFSFTTTSRPAATIGVNVTPATVAAGQQVNISWQSQNAPSGSVVDVVLYDTYDTSGRITGLITAPNAASGSYSWTIPTLGTGCPPDFGGVCGMSPGTYTVRAFLRDRHECYGFCPYSSVQTYAQGDASITIGNTPAVNDRLTSPSALTAGQAITSPNGQYKATYQSDGHFVVTRGTTPVWYTGAFGVNPGQAVMQADGNFVNYSADGAAYWSSQTHGRGTAPYALIIQDNGTLVIKDGTGASIWATGTVMGASTSNQGNLANALAALQSALQALSALFVR